MIPIGKAVDRSGKSWPAKEWAFHVRTQGKDLYIQLLRRGPGWKAEIVKTKNTPNKRISISVLEIDQVNGLPHTAELKIRIENKTETIVVTPEDRIATPSLSESATISFLPDSGYYPTFFLSMLGAVGTGKSCFACAAQTRTVAQQIRKLLPHGYNTVHTRQQQPRLPPTELARVSQYPFEMLDDRGRVRAMCYLIDASGELSVDRRPIFDSGGMQTEESYYGGDLDDRTASLILRRITRLSDAILIVIDDRAFQPNTAVRGDAIQLLQRLNRQRKLPSNICFVCTHSDKLQEKLQNSPDGLDLAGARLCSDSLVFSEATDFEGMNRHMAVARQVLSPLLDPAFPATRTGCFMIQSVEEYTGPGGRAMLDFTKAKNVALPLAYVFDRLIKIA